MTAPLSALQLIGIVVQTPEALPGLWWDDPGEGKTTRLRMLFATILVLPLETVIASIRDPTDFIGLAVPDAEGKLRYAASPWAQRIADCVGAPSANDRRRVRGGVLLDEASCAVPATQAAMLRPVLEGWVGDLQLPDGVRWIAAANPPETAAGGWDLAPSLANRFTHIVGGGPTDDEWIEWVQRGRSIADDVPVLNLDRWEQEMAIAKATVCGFRKAKPGTLREKYKAYQGRFPLAWASPRSWWSLTCLHAACRAVDRQDALVPLAEGSVGKPLGLEYATYARKLDLPDPDYLIENPDKYTPDPRRPDRDFAIIGSVAERAILRRGKSEKLYLERWVGAWQVLGRAMTLGKGYVATAARTLVEKKNYPKGGLLHPEVGPLIDALKPVLDEAGLMPSA
jgi:hypothetical protein